MQKKKLALNIECIVDLVALHFFSVLQLFLIQNILVNNLRDRYLYDRKTVLLNLFSAYKSLKHISFKDSDNTIFIFNSYEHAVRHNINFKFFNLKIVDNTIDTAHILASSRIGSLSLDYELACREGKIEFEIVSDARTGFAFYYNNYTLDNPFIYSYFGFNQGELLYNDICSNYGFVQSLVQKLMTRNEIYFDIFNTWHIYHAWNDPSEQTVVDQGNIHLS